MQTVCVYAACCLVLGESTVVNFCYCCLFINRLRYSKQRYSLTNHLEKHYASMDDDQSCTFGV